MRSPLPFLVTPLALVLGAGSAAGYALYTLAESVVVAIPAGEATIRGTFEPAPPEEVATWDLSTGGNDADAPPGTHACADLGFNPGAFCGIDEEFQEIDVVAFRLTLDGSSAPVSQAGPAFSPSVQTAFGGSAYIIPEEGSADRIPVSSAGGQFQIQKFEEPTNAAFYLQPGESTVWLLSRYQGGAVGNALTSGATLRMAALSGTLGGGQSPELVLMPVPEPGAPLASAVALLSAFGMAMRRRTNVVGADGIEPPTPWV